MRPAWAAKPFCAQHQFYLTRQATVAACSAFDYVISPTAPNLPAPAEWAGDHINLLSLWNTSPLPCRSTCREQPAASVNCGYAANGLPIGLHRRRPV